MERDIRSTALYGEIYDLCTRLRRPGTGQISDAAEIDAAPTGNHAVFSGAIVDKLDGAAETRVCRVDLNTGDTRVLTFGPNSDRLPRYSPDGRWVAFLSDRSKAGDFQLFLLDPSIPAARATMRVPGWVEYFHWSPNGKRILLGVAGHGADIAGGLGAVATEQVGVGEPAWMPSVETGKEEYRRRSVWVYELSSAVIRRVTGQNWNVWEAVWCGDDKFAAVMSPGPDEGCWYESRLYLIDLNTGSATEVYRPGDQIGWPAASPSGMSLAIVEAVCSDRGLVAGNVKVLDTRSGDIRAAKTAAVDVTYLEWCSERRLLLAGHRGFETVVGVWDSVTGQFDETWSSEDVSTGGIYATLSGIGEDGSAVLIAEGFQCAPEVGVIRRRQYRTVRSFDLGYRDEIASLHDARRLTWQARGDGLDINGWLLEPKGGQPFPLITSVHGGPVWHVRPTYLGRWLATLTLMRHGYAVLFPNIRGSSGRGQEFSRLVQGDMAGADALDCLDGIDYLLDRKIVNPKRLGLTGGSYGGFMTAWLVTQDQRFAAAVAVAPITNHVTWHLLSSIPNFVPLFLRDTYTEPNGRYFHRSPIVHAHRVKTPTLSICGALDRVAPPQEAVQFHNALRENGVESVLVTYPQEGHGVRKWPAAIDYATRLVQWFEHYMPPN